MPTVNIPDKICPHCGGTKWMSGIVKRTNQKGITKVYTVYRCIEKMKANAVVYKQNNIDAVRAWEREKHRRRRLSEEFRKRCNKRHRNSYAKNKDKHLARNKAWLKANPEKAKEKNRIAALKHIRRLPDGYILNRITRGTTINKSDIPEEIIQLKRKQIMLKRELTPLKPHL